MSILRRVAVAGMVLLSTMVFASVASAGIVVSIDKSAQRMTVTVDGVKKYYWPVSTGARGYTTPSGTFQPFRMEEEHFSEEWDDAPMPMTMPTSRSPVGSLLASPARRASRGEHGPCAERCQLDEGPDSTGSSAGACSLA